MCAGLCAQENSLVYHPFPIFTCHKIIIDDKDIVDKAYKWLLEKNVHKVDDDRIGYVMPTVGIEFTGTAYELKKFKIVARSPNAVYQGELTYVELYDLQEVLGLDRLAQYFARPEWAKHTDGAAAEAAHPSGPHFGQVKIPEGPNCNQFLETYFKGSAISILTTSTDNMSLIYRPYNSPYKVKIWCDIGIFNRVYKFLIDKKIHILDSDLIGSALPVSIIEFQGVSYEHKVFKIYNSDPDKYIEGTLPSAEMYDLYYLLSFDLLAREFTRPEWVKEGTPENVAWLAEHEAYYRARAEAEAEARARGERLPLGWKPPKAAKAPGGQTTQQATAQQMGTTGSSLSSCSPAVNQPNELKPTEPTPTSSGTMKPSGKPMGSGRGLQEKPKTQ